MKLTKIIIAFFKVIISSYCIKFLHSSFKDYIICDKKLDTLRTNCDQKFNSYIKNN